MFPIDIRGWVHLAVKLRGYFTKMNNSSWYVAYTHPIISSTVLAMKF